MDTDLPPADPATAAELSAAPAAFEPLISRLDALSRHHLLYFRIEVGRALLEELFGGDVGALRDLSPTKESSLRAFARAHRDRLADLGLNEALLRQSIDAHLVVAHLPAEVVRHLLFSHVVYLSQVPDLPTRGLLAQAAVDNSWSGPELRDAVQRARAGLWIDAKPDEPGLQPSGGDDLPPPPPGKPLPPARVVTRVEKGVVAFAEATAAWSDVPVEALTAPQRARVERALAEMEARVAEMRRRLG